MIIGITGMLGAGKGVSAEYLASKGLLHYSIRNFLASELNRRGIPASRSALIDLGNELRAVFGPGYIVGKLQKGIPDNRDAVIESIRAVGEIESLRQNPDFQLVAVTTDARIRYERLRQRNQEIDQISFEEFLGYQKRESVSGNPGEQNLLRCLEMADYTITNNGDLSTLHHAWDDLLSTIKKAS